jgi:hypothetical protein
VDERVESLDDGCAGLPEELESEVRRMRVGKLIRMSFIFASRVSPDCCDLFGKDEDLWSFVSNGLKVLGRLIGASSMSEVDEGSASVDEMRSSSSRDWRLTGLRGIAGELVAVISNVPARDLATALA